MSFLVMMPDLMFVKIVIYSPTTPAGVVDCTEGDFYKRVNPLDSLKSIDISSRNDARGISCL